MVTAVCTSVLVYANAHILPHLANIVSTKEHTHYFTSPKFKLPEQVGQSCLLSTLEGPILLHNF